MKAQTSHIQKIKVALFNQGKYKIITPAWIITNSTASTWVAKQLHRQVDPETHATTIVLWRITNQDLGQRTRMDHRILIRRMPVIQHMDIETQTEIARPIIKNKTKVLPLETQQETPTMTSTTTISSNSQPIQTHSLRAIRWEWEITAWAEILSTWVIISYKNKAGNSTTNQWEESKNKFITDHKRTINKIQ